MSCVYYIIYVHIKKKKNNKKERRPPWNHVPILPECLIIFHFAKITDLTISTQLRNAIQTSGIVKQLLRRDAYA